MLASRRGAVALAVVLIATLVAPAAAAGRAPTTDHDEARPTKPPPTDHDAGPPRRPRPRSTRSRVPPPPAFTLPIDLGLKLLAQRDQANTGHPDLRRRAARPTARNEQAVERTWQRAAAPARAACEAQVRETQHDLDVAHANLQAAAVEAYMNSGSSRLEAAISAIASASSALDASRTMHLIGSFGDQQDELVKQYVALEKRLKAEQRQVSERRTRRRR